MPIATHLITVQGMFDKTWADQSIRKYIKEKTIWNIDSSFYTSIEELRINKNNIYVSVLISGLPSEVSKSIVLKWIKDNVVENGLTVTWFGIKIINSLIEPDMKFTIRLD